MSSPLAYFSFRSGRCGRSMEFRDLFVVATKPHIRPFGFTDRVSTWILSPSNPRIVRAHMTWVSQEAVLALVGISAFSSLDARTSISSLPELTNKTQVVFGFDGLTSCWSEMGNKDTVGCTKVPCRQRASSFSDTQLGTDNPIPCFSFLISRQECPSGKTPETEQTPDTDPTIL